jgi:hypothetical protein
MHDDHTNLRRFSLAGLCCVLPFAWTICLAGCGSNPKLGSVEGIVRLDGEPLSTGTVRFIPAAGRAASGEIQSDGTFRLGTYAKTDGAMIGLHQVAITAIESDPDAPTEGRMLKRNPKVKRLIPERYTTTATSRLTADVKPGRNEFTFDLTSR